MTLRVLAPLNGRVVPLADVPDAVFSAGMLGPGLALDPDPGVVEVVAPVPGTVAALHPHAFAIEPPAGPAVLVHLGIDTVGLHGDGFTVHAAKGDELAAGDRVITFDPAPARARGLSVVCPVVLLETAPDTVTVRATGPVRTGDPLFDVRG